MSVSARLAKLAGDGPREFDIDAVDEFGDNTVAGRSSGGAVEDEDLEMGAPQYRQGIDMGEDARYEGVPTSRRSLRQQRLGSDSDDGSMSDGSDAGMGSYSSGSESDEETGNSALSSKLASQVATDDIEAELEALESGDQQLLMPKRQESDKDRARDTRHQIELWERTLELRIRMQKAIGMAHRLPKGTVRDAFVQQGAGEAFSGAAASVDSLLATLHGMHDELVEQSGVFEPVSDSDIDEDEDPLDAHWRRIQSRWTALEPQVVDVVSEWQRKLLYSSGLSAKKQLKVVNQDLRKQTEGVLANRDVLVERARVKRAEASRELGNELTYPIGGETGDPDTYDDPEFYQQLLREFIKTTTSSQAVPGARQARKSVKKDVDRKASKGRKLRYHAHPKLVNFMAPIPAPAPPLDLDSLHASLFKSRS